ncbi:uncharacterized protein [Periplaneta americana]
MDDLKMEPDSDPLAIQTSDNADTEERKLSSEEGNLLDFHFTEIKTESIEQRYDVKSEMTYEEAAVSVDFPIVKNEAEEGNLLDFHFTEIKTESIEHTYDVKSEMTYEEAAVSIDFPIVKNEAEENSCELDEVSDEGKPEVTGEENEVLTES